MHRKLLLPSALAAVLALAACDKGVTGPGSPAQLTAGDAQALASETGDQDGAFLDGFGAPSFNMIPSGPQFATTVTTTFTRTRTCPQGGDVKLAGTVVHTADPATHSGSTNFSATRTENACAFNRNGNTLTITGNPNTQLTASQSWTNGVPGVRTATKVGSFTWSRSDGKSGTCNVNVTATWTPATHTLHVTGTFCNQTVDVTRTWTQT
ncbi:MAG TPA: hypothetical protein VGO40_15905 [Longimicrobium sp.]|jgi:hypothetical protein|nr:hypothetical protein [Longimicrobium sp.]